MEPNKPPITAPADWGGIKSNTHYAWIDNKVYAIRPTKEFVLYKGRWRHIQDDGIGGKYVEGPGFVVSFEIKEFEKPDTKQNKITPLKLTTNPLEVQGIDEVATIWRDDKEGSALIASLSGSPGTEEGREFGKRLVLSYNNTYGAGINPESVPDMLSALRIAKSAILHSGATSGQTNYDALDSVSAAIEKAKL